MYLCQRRQDWYREYAAKIGEERKPFVESVTLAVSPDVVALQMQRVFDFGVDERQTADSLTGVLKIFIERAEAAGVLVMFSSMVGPNTKRKLDPGEFRGFTLTDPVAPLVFVNSADAEAAQMFTLAHELAHLWLGSSALSDADLPNVVSDATEQWCNRVAAEFLVPLAAMRGMNLDDPLSHLKEYTRRFKVSRLVILRRLMDAELISREQFQTAYVVASQSYKPPKKADKGGPDFNKTYPRTASKRLIRALYLDTVEGNTTYTEALQLLGISKAETLRNLAKNAGAA